MERTYFQSLYHSKNSKYFISLSIKIIPRLIVNKRAHHMGKLKSAEPNLGRVFNSRCRHASTQFSTFTSPKQPILQLKTRPKQLLGSLLLDFALPVIVFFTFPAAFVQKKVIKGRLGKDRFDERMRLVSREHQLKGSAQYG